MRLKRDTDSGRSFATRSSGSAELSSAGGTGGLAAVAVVAQTRVAQWPLGNTLSVAWVLSSSGWSSDFQPASLPPPKVSGYVPVTHDGIAKTLLGTDGARLYFQENQSVTSVGVIAQVSSSGGEVARIAVPSPTMRLLAVSP